MKARGKWNSLATTHIEARYPRTIIPCKPHPYTKGGGPLLLSGIGALQVGGMLDGRPGQVYSKLLKELR